MEALGPSTKSPIVRGRLSIAAAGKSGTGYRRFSTGGTLWYTPPCQLIEPLGACDCSDSPMDSKRLLVCNIIEAEPPAQVGDET